MAHRRWVAVSALAMTMAAGAITSPLLGVLAPYLVADFGIAVGTLGLGGSLYYVAAALLSPAAGGLVEGRTPVTVLWWIALATPVTVLLFSMAPNFPTLVAAVALGSVPLALANPATNAAVAAWFEPGSRGTATGWKQAGVPGATLLVGLVAPGVAEAAGWRLAVVATGAVLLVVLVALLLAAPGGRPAETPAPATGRAAHAHALDRAGLGWLLPYSVLMGTAVGATNIYLVQFGVDGYGLSPPVAGRLAILTGLAGALSRPALAAYAERRGATARMLTWLAALATVGVVVLAVGPSLGSGRLPVMVVAVVLAGLSIHAWNGVAMLGVVIHAPAGRIGGASGLVMRAFYAGLLIGPMVFGQVLQRLGYSHAWALVALATATAFLLSARSRSAARVRVGDPFTGI